MIYNVRSPLFQSFLNHNLTFASSDSLKRYLSPKWQMQNLEPSAEKTMALSESLSACDIPSDIVVDILSRLPVQSVMRFRHVNKSWCTLFGDPSFVSLHYKQTRVSNNEHLLLELEDKDKTGKSLHSGLTLGRTFKPTLFKQMSLKFKVESCCNGLICLRNLQSAAGSADIYFWNPAIRKVKILPDYVRCPRDRIGFGFLPRQNELKVVKMVYPFFLDETLSNVKRFTPEVEVFSFSSYSWKRVSTVIPCTTFDETWTFVNEAVHWRVINTNAETHILAFDLANEVFQRINLPDCYCAINLIPFVNFVPKQLGEYLSVLVYEEDYCYIWVMKEYGIAKSWSLEFKVDWMSVFHIIPTDFTRSGKLLFRARLQRESNTLRFLSLESMKMTYLSFRTGDVVYDWDAYLCSDNLILLDGGDDIALHSDLFDEDECKEEGEI